MRWRNIIIGALLGGLLGVTGQILLDYYRWNHRFPYLILLMENARINDYLRGKNEYLGWGMHIDERDLQNARQLWCEAKLLTWLEYRGETTARMGLVVAFLSTSSLLAAEQSRKKRKLQKEATA
jgi:hypothetical protein